MDPVQLVLTAVAVLLAATIHECAHAYAAVQLGDPTPRWMGRLTLNPLAHLDPLGTLLLLLVGFGWAKPVPVNPRHFRDPRQGMLLVAVAGPLANVCAVAGLGALYRLDLVPEGDWVEDLWFRLLYVNAVLAVFNLLPIPPLDGSLVLEALLRGEAEYVYARLQPYGGLLLAILLVTGWLGSLLRTPVMWLVRWALGT